MTPHAAGTTFVSRSGGIVGWTIRLLTRSRVNHAGICTGTGGTIEAQAAGAVILREHDPGPNIIYGTHLHNRLETLKPGIGADIWEQARRLIGTKYNFLDLAALAWASHHDPTEPPEKPNWWQRRIMRDDRLICSQLVDLAHQRAGVHLFNDGRLPGQVTPGDLETVLANPDWPITVDS